MQPRYPGSICDVAGLLLGHAQDTEAMTGCSVVIAPEGAIGGCEVRGAAPGTRETDLMKPGNQVERIHAVVLSGGSAFGLDAASGVMAQLESQGIGFAAGMRQTRVPIVAGAVLFDLDIGRSDVRPDAAMGRAAACAAGRDELRQGSVGAGTGATVAKLPAAIGMAVLPVKGGIGMATLHLSGGLVVSALVAVNALGDVYDPETCQYVAQAALNGAPVSSLDVLLSPDAQSGDVPPGGNTTIGIVATNARLTPASASRVCVAAHDGLALAIRPAHTLADGDTMFCMAAGDVEANPVVLGAAVSRVVARACVNAVLMGRP